MRRRPGETTGVAYWDASALVSMVVEDGHSSATRRVAAEQGVLHFVSSLALAEVHAVIGRLVRERIMTPEQIREARARLAGGPWRSTRIQPDVGRLGELALQYPLRGADLWHLGAARALADLLPGLQLLPFDDRLRAAARAEGMGGP